MPSPKALAQQVTVTALLFLLPSPRKALRQGLWDASRAGLLRPSSLQNTSNDAWWFLQQRVFLAAWKLRAQLEPINRNLHFLRNKAAAFQTSSPLSTSWAEHPNLKAVICLSLEENSVATEQPMRWSLFCSRELSLPPASATTQHRGNESRAWASYKFLSLEAVTDMINYFFFCKCCLEFNKCSYVLLIWNINPKSHNKITQAFQAISEAC